MSTETVARAAGTALAKQYFRRGDLLDGPLHALTEESSEAFDAEVGRLQR